MDREELIDRLDAKADRCADLAKQAHDDGDRRSLHKMHAKADAYAEAAQMVREAV